jgi:hypothetical protein
MIGGTLQYMAPEHSEGEPADARSDLFFAEGGWPVSARCRREATEHPLD